MLGREQHDGWAVGIYLLTCWPPFPEDRSKRVVARFFGRLSGLNLNAHSLAAEKSSSEYADSEVASLWVVFEAN